MSYILDALSKSQTQRERGAVPTLMTDFPPKETKSRATKLWLSAAIGLLSIGMLASGYALSGRTQNPQSSSEEMAKVTEPSASPTPDSALAVSAVTHSSTATRRTIPSRSRQDQLWASTVDDATVVEKARTRQPKLVNASAVSATPEPPKVEVPDARLTPASQWLIGELSALEQTSRSAEPRKQASPSTTQSEGAASLAYAAASASAPVRSSGTQRSKTHAGQAQPVVPSSPVSSSNLVPAIREMSRETRDSLPSMEINVHSYAESPEERMVIINMKRYREGDRMVEGPTVAAITRTGAVLVHEKQRFRLPLR